MRSGRLHLLSVFVVAMAFLAPTSAASAAPANASGPGSISTPYPTLQSITISWPFAGDDDSDARVRVRYRVSGATVWRDSMALMRVSAGSNAGHSWVKRHTGSLVDLVPGTRYQIELRLTDPDGGSTTRVVTVRTRAVPVINAKAPVRSATPATLDAVKAAARPGDIVELGPGTYPAFTWDVDGTPTQPIVLRGTPGAVIAGELGMFFRKNVHLDRLTVRGRIRFNGSDNIAITRSTVHAQVGVGGGDGIVSSLRARNAYIADNTVVGTTPWRESALGADGDNLGEGILVTGPGTVIMNNRVSNFRDNISTLEGDEAAEQYSIDILNNDISQAADDAIEADYCFHNCRIMRNRITNAFMGVSAQPSLGGPTYIVRNVMYNVIDSAFKLHNGSDGDVVVNNTVVKNGDANGIYSGVPILRATFRNNLMVGGPGGVYNGWENGTGQVISVGTMTNSSLDYDALGSTTNAFVGQLNGTRFASLAELRSLTSEKHAVRVDLKSFAARIAYPAKPLTRYAVPDLRLAPTSQAIDAGLRMPGLTDRFVGSAPDAGAYERGRAIPAYGPRT